MFYRCSCLSHASSLYLTYCGFCISTVENRENTFVIVQFITYNLGTGKVKSYYNNPAIYPI
jgi:hypothetical protein